MALDSETEQYVRHQSERRAFWLAQTPPDRKEADRCLTRIDAFLDRRRRVVAVASDGEAVMSDASPWVQAQATAVNVYEPERVLTSDQLAEVAATFEVPQEQFLPHPSSTSLPCEACGTRLVRTNAGRSYYCPSCSGATPAAHPLTPGGGVGVLDAPKGLASIDEDEILRIRKELGLDPS